MSTSQEPAPPAWAADMERRLSEQIADSERRLSEQIARMGRNVAVIARVSYVVELMNRGGGG